MWPKSDVGSIGGVLQLSADPTSIDRAIISAAPASGIHRHHLLRHMESKSLPTPGRRLWPEAGVRQEAEATPCGVPRLPPEAELTSWPCPGMHGCTFSSAAAPPPQPGPAPLGDTGVLCFCSRRGDTC